MQANRELAGDQLSFYRSKRSPETIPDPFGGNQGERLEVLVVQKLAAQSLRYDLRLEWEGVLLSWTIPEGPSLDSGEERLTTMCLLERTTIQRWLEDRDERI